MSTEVLPSVEQQSSADSGVQSRQNQPRFKLEDFISEGFIIKNSDESVVKFINEHPYFNGVIKVIRDELRNYFPGSGIFLEVGYEPETEEIYLNIGVSRNGRSVKEAFNVLKKFDHEWWIDRADMGQGLLNITLEHSV